MLFYFCQKKRGKKFSNGWKCWKFFPKYIRFDRQERGFVVIVGSGPVIGWLIIGSWTIRCTSAPSGRRESPDPSSGQRNRNVSSRSQYESNATTTIKGEPTCNARQLRYGKAA